MLSLEEVTRMQEHEKIAKIKNKIVKKQTRITYDYIRVKARNTTKQNKNMRNGEIALKHIP